MFKRKTLCGTSRVGPVCRAPSFIDDGIATETGGGQLAACTLNTVDGPERAIPSFAAFSKSLRNVWTCHITKRVDPSLLPTKSLSEANLGAYSRPQRWQQSLLAQIPVNGSSAKRWALPSEHGVLSLASESQVYLVRHAIATSCDLSKWPAFRHR